MKNKQNNCQKDKIFGISDIMYQRNTYLCSVFFIVLDLRLSRLGATAVAPFLYKQPYKQPYNQPYKHTYNHFFKEKSKKVS